MQGILYASEATNTAGARWAVIATIELMHISEIQSGRTRAAATSDQSSSGPYLLFGSTTILVVVVCLL
ncbi:hypothetical protein BT69DRAFT_832759 [Atractiella rhizophila]|nr:hypothetical protein BT69DRAFT_832759 [Atractiella rhizophila]